MTEPKAMKVTGVAWVRGYIVFCGRISGMFPPALAHSLLLSALIAAIERPMGVKSAHCTDRDAEGSFGPARAIDEPVLAKFVANEIVAPTSAPLLKIPQNSAWAAVRGCYNMIQMHDRAF